VCVCVTEGFLKKTFIESLFVSEMESLKEMQTVREYYLQVHVWRGLVCRVHQSGMRRYPPSDFHQVWCLNRSFDKG